MEVRGGSRARIVAAATPPSERGREGRLVRLLSLLAPPLCTALPAADRAEGRPLPGVPRALEQLGPAPVPLAGARASGRRSPTTARRGHRAAAQVPRRERARRPHGRVDRGRRARRACSRTRSCRCRRRRRAGARAASATPRCSPRRSPSRTGLPVLRAARARGRARPPGRARPQPAPARAAPFQRRMRAGSGPVVLVDDVVTTGPRSAPAHMRCARSRMAVAGAQSLTLAPR